MREAEREKECAGALSAIQCVRFRAVIEITKSLFGHFVENLIPKHDSAHIFWNEQRDHGVTVEVCGGAKKSAL